MPYLLKLVIPCLLLGASVTAQEVTTRSINGVACQADRRYDQLQSNTQSKMDSYKAQLDAMMTCQTDKNYGMAPNVLTLRRLHRLPARS
jgi:hypothetical protein